MQAPIRILKNKASFLPIHFALLISLFSVPPGIVSAAPQNPIVFVGQVPVAGEAFGKVTAPFSNHLASMVAAPRGGGLFIRYPDGSVENLTEAAGYNGINGPQTGPLAIAVRDPSVHWNGNKVIFSMVAGAPGAQYEVGTYHWQLYEITGLEKGQSRTVTKVPFQSEEYNNVMPFYGIDNSIYFVSDQPRDGLAHLYPQLGEKESAPSTSGIWRLNPSSGAIEIIKYTPSGAFEPFIDSRGKIVYAEADFLQQDPQAVGDRYGAFNYASESAGATKLLSDKKEFFPEPQVPVGNQNAFQFGYQLPWETSLSGSDTTSLFGLGRHELLNYFEASLNGDPAIKTFLVQFSSRATQNSVFGLTNISESNANPAKYLATNAAPYVYNTHGAGQIVELIPDPAHGPQGLDLKYITSQETVLVTNSAPAGHSGFYRDPLALTNGELIAAHTPHTESNRDLSSPQTGDRTLDTLYEFRIRQLVSNGSSFEAGSYLTGSGIEPAVPLSYFDPDDRIEFSGKLWELQPVELTARNRPNAFSAPLQTPEAGLFEKEKVDLDKFKEYLTDNNLALLVVRDATSRDGTDQQQPYNLKVSDSAHTTTGEEGTLYEVAALQVFQANHLRGYERPKGDTSEVDLVNGRRILPVPIAAVPGSPHQSSSAEGSFELLPDGSAAALVPADRPLTWQLVDTTGKGVVHERYWFNLRAGEIAACGSCHPANNGNQSGAPEPDHQARALRGILRWWKGEPLSIPPEYALDVRGTRKRRRITQQSFKEGKVFTRRQYQISVQPAGGDIDFQDLELHLKINKKACATPILIFQSRKDGTAAIVGNGPRIPRPRVRLDFDLINDGSVKQTATARLIRRGFPRDRNRSIKKPRRFARMCQKVARSLAVVP